MKALIFLLASATAAWIVYGMFHYDILVRSVEESPLTGRGTWKSVEP